jgi:holo-[acyl-carrier protein] synthase
MIVAIGTDIVEIARIERALDNARTGDRFRRRVFTPREIDYCTKRPRYAQSFAARFAAKEAVMKVLGTGFGEGIGWQEIEVVRKEDRPAVVLSGRARKRANELHINRWHLSLSHTDTNAIAYVVAEDERTGCRRG